MLSRILTVGLLAGFLAGLVTTGLQMALTVPMIAEAEIYENSDQATATPGHGARQHGQAQTAQTQAQSTGTEAGGFERPVMTTVTNILIGVGGGLMIAAAFALRKSEATWLTGIAWGMAAYLSINLAPALGLPPELPGVSRAPLESRQFWWALTAFSTAAGIAFLVYGRAAWRLAGVVFLLLPHMVGAPVFSEGDSPLPQALTNEFIGAALAASGLFWLVLGGAVGALARRFRLTGASSTLES